MNLKKRATLRPELITELEARGINPDDAPHLVFRYGTVAAETARRGVPVEAAVMQSADAVEQALANESRTYGDGSYGFSDRYQTWEV